MCRRITRQPRPCYTRPTFGFVLGTENDTVLSARYKKWQAYVSCHAQNGPFRAPSTPATTKFDAAVGPQVPEKLHWKAAVGYIHSDMQCLSLPVVTGVLCLQISMAIKRSVWCLILLICNDCLHTAPSRLTLTPTSPSVSACLPAFLQSRKKSN